MIMAFTVDTKSAMVFFITIPVLSIIIFGIMAISMPIYKKIQKYLEQITLVTRENLVGVRVIRAFNQQEKECAQFDEESNLLLKSQKYVGKIAGLLNH